MDICQASLANLFARAAAGQFELETPEQLLKLLGATVRNKVTDCARHAQRQCRDPRRESSAIVGEPLKEHPENAGIRRSHASFESPGPRRPTRPAWDR